MVQNPDKEKWNEFDWELELRKDDARVCAYAADLPKYIDLPDEDGVIMTRIQKHPELAPAGGDPLSNAVESDEAGQWTDLVGGHVCPALRKANAESRCSGKKAEKETE